MEQTVQSTATPCTVMEWHWCSLSCTAEESFSLSRPSRDIASLAQVKTLETWWDNLDLCQLQHFDSQNIDLRMQIGHEKRGQDLACTTGSTSPDPLSFLPITVLMMCADIAVLL